MHPSKTRSPRKHLIGIAALALALAGALALVTACSSTGSTGSTATTNTAATNTATAATNTAATSATAAEPASIGIAYQYGLSYAPAVIAKEQGLIEKHYKEATGNDVEIQWNQLSSGADINTGITSGSIDVGFMGIAPAITGIATGLDYKVFTNLSGQEHGLMTSDASITSLGDLVGSDTQIALVNTGSIQHLMLAKALADNGYDAHALDSNIVAMKHPDGMAALQSGSIPCHLTSSPYIFTERADSSLHELTEVNDAWTKDDSFIVGVASNALHDDEALYQAVCDAIAEGQRFIAENPEEAAELLCEFDGNTAEEELEFLKQGSYSAETSGLLEMASFMAEHSFIDAAPGSYADLAFSNVKGD